MPHLECMTQHETDIPATGDLVDYHRGLAEGHAARALAALDRWSGQPSPGEMRPGVLHEQINANLKVADVHARLAQAVAVSGPQGAATTSDLTFAGDSAAHGVRVLAAIEAAKKLGLA